MKNRYVLAAALTVSSLAVSAVNAAEENESNWKMSAELGIVATSGNSETSTTNAKFDATHEEEKWRHNIHAEALGTSTTDTTTDIESTSAERYQLSGKSDYKYSEFDYIFGTVVYDKDRFSGYDYQATVVVGYGRRLLAEEDMTLDVEIGPGYRKVKDGTTGATDGEGIVRLGAKYKWEISDNATFTQDLTSDVASDLTVTKSVTALTAKVNSKLAMKVSLTIKNNSEVPVTTPETDKTDTETAVTLVYSF